MCACVRTVLASPSSSKVCQTIKTASWQLSQPRVAGVDRSLRANRNAKNIIGVAGHLLARSVTRHSNLRRRYRTTRKRIANNGSAISVPSCLSILKSSWKSTCYRDHEMPIACPLCDKTFTSLYGRDRHVEVQLSETWALKCPCGLKLQDAKKLEQHATHCVLSKRGATLAIKRKFAELCADTEDRNTACTQAFAEVRAEAKKRLECKCNHCGLCFADKESLKRHKRKTHKGENDGQRSGSSSAVDSV